MYLSIQLKRYSVVAHKTFTGLDLAELFVDGHPHVIKKLNDDSTHCVVVYQERDNLTFADVHLTTSLASATELLYKIAKNDGLSVISPEYAMKPYHFAEVLSDINVVEI